MQVDGLVQNPLYLSINDIRTRYQQHEVTSILQCAGNRRHAMQTLLDETEGIDWGDAAVMNCQWKGARLRDILLDAQPITSPAQDLHVAFSCYEAPVKGTDWYGGSISLERAIDADADVLVVLEVSFPNSDWEPYH